jgi:hypothetical protein
LAAGLAPEWIEGEGVRVKAMPTLYGALSYSLRRLEDGALRFEFSGVIAANIILRPPLQAPLRGVRVDGAECTTFDNNSITLPSLPAEVICITV